MAFYLQVAKDLTSRFDSFEITHFHEKPIGLPGLLRALTKIQLAQWSLLHLSIDGSLVNILEEGVTWMTLIIKYLVDGELSLDKNESRSVFDYLFWV